MSNSSLLLKRNFQPPMEEISLECNRVTLLISVKGKAMALAVKFFQVRLEGSKFFQIRLAEVSATPRDPEAMVPVSK